MTLDLFLNANRKIIDGIKTMKNQTFHLIFKDYYNFAQNPKTDIFNEKDEHTES